jgi:hypothetical protein
MAWEVVVSGRPHGSRGERRGLSRNS